MEKVSTVQKVDADAAIRSARNWQNQADSVTEESTYTELMDALMDWGIAQGFLNYAKQVKLISWDDYERMSRRQLRVREKLNHFLKEKRIHGTVNATICR